MESLFIAGSDFSPEIKLSHKESTFYLRGNSRPEDVREMYLPVLSWLSEYREFLNNQPVKFYSEENPLVFEFDFGYFNSSSAKFLYDIMQELKKIRTSGVKLSTAWCYEEDDIDMKEAGEDLAILAEIDLIYIKKPS